MSNSSTLVLSRLNNARISSFLDIVMVLAVIWTSHPMIKIGVS